MDNQIDRIQELVNHPSESLSVELKTWLDPDSPEEKIKLVKAAIALRNQNGGYLVIGFNNETLKPDLNSVPSEIRRSFHIDKIKDLISKYSSVPFVIDIIFPTRDGQNFPVLLGRII